MPGVSGSLSSEAISQSGLPETDRRGLLVLVILCHRCRWDLWSVRSLSYDNLLICIRQIVQPWYALGANLSLLLEVDVLVAPRYPVVCNAYETQRFFCSLSHSTAWCAEAVPYAKHDPSSWGRCLNRWRCTRYCSEKWSSEPHGECTSQAPKSKFAR